MRLADVDQAARDRRPLPLQVREQILGLMRRDGLQAGDAVPAESELAARFGVARTTIRESLKLLEQEGVLDVRRGIGRFVSALPRLEQSITRLEGTTEMMRRLGYVVSDRVLDVRLRAASPDEARALSIPVADRVVYLERVRMHEGNPLTYSQVTFSDSLLGGEDVEGIDWGTPLLQLMDARGHRIAASETRIQSVFPPPSAVDAGFPEDLPCLLLIQRNVSEVGRPLLFAQDYFRGDLMTLSVVRRREV